MGAVCGCLADDENPAEPEEANKPVQDMDNSKVNLIHPMNDQAMKNAAMYNNGM